MLKRCYQAEPIVMLLIGNGVLWPSLFAVLASFNHPVTDAQQHAIIGFAAVISALVARQAVVAPDTAAQQLAQQQMAQKLGS